MSKAHLDFKVNGEYVGGALCGNNGRRYHMGLRVLPPKAYRMVAAAQRCQHCERLYLERRNQIRVKKGLPMVATPFEGLDHA